MNKNYITFGQVTVGKVTVGQVVALFLFAALFSMSMLAISYWMDDRRRKKTLKKMSSNNLDMSKPLRPHDILDMEEVKNRTEIRRLIRLINEQLIKNKEVFKNQDSIEFSMKIINTTYT
jgi:ABC-type multidrug transport system fused ATPase/permease subunit